MTHRGATRWEAIAGITLWLVASVSLIVIGVGSIIIWRWVELPFAELAAIGGACLTGAGLISLARPTTQ